MCGTSYVSWRNAKYCGNAKCQQSIPRKCEECEETQPGSNFRVLPDRKNMRCQTCEKPSCEHCKSPAAKVIQRNCKVRGKWFCQQPACEQAKVVYRGQQSSWHPSQHFEKEEFAKETFARLLRVEYIPDTQNQKHSKISVKIEPWASKIEAWGH